MGDSSYEKVVVELEVGGSRFLSSRTTLESRDSFFRALLYVEKQKHYTDFCKTPSFFIDRDPTHFRHVLNFLRGCPSFPPTEREICELEKEADFYSLQPLSLLCREEAERVRKEKNVCYWLDRIETKMT